MNRFAGLQNDFAAGEDICVTALVRGKQKFIVLTKPSRLDEALAVIERWKNDPEIPLSESDAEQLSVAVLESIT